MNIGIHKSSVMSAGVLALLLATAACNQDDGNSPSPATTPAPAAPALPVTAPLSPLTTVIANKDAVDKITDATLTLNFTVIGGATTVSINDLRFQCKREGEADFSTCPSGSVYRFGSLKAGTTYELTVQAVSISTGTIAVADSLSFSVAK